MVCSRRFWTAPSAERWVDTFWIASAMVLIAAVALDASLPFTFNPVTWRPDALIESMLRLILLFAVESAPTWRLISIAAAWVYVCFIFAVDVMSNAAPSLVAVPVTCFELVIAAFNAANSASLASSSVISSVPAFWATILFPAHVPPSASPEVNLSVNLPVIESKSLLSLILDVSLITLLSVDTSNFLYTPSVTAAFVSSPLSK